MCPSERGLSSLSDVPRRVHAMSHEHDRALASIIARAGHTHSHHAHSMTHLWLWLSAPSAEILAVDVDELSVRRVAIFAVRVAAHSVDARRQRTAASIRHLRDRRLVAPALAQSPGGAATQLRVADTVLKKTTPKQRDARLRRTHFDYQYG